MIGSVGNPLESERRPNIKWSRAGYYLVHPPLALGLSLLAVALRLLVFHLPRAICLLDAMSATPIATNRRKRGVSRASITKLRARLGELEGFASLPDTIGLAKRLSTRLQVLTADFKTCHYMVVELLDTEDDLQRKQDILDKHDEEVAVVLHGRLILRVPRRRLTKGGGYPRVGREITTTPIEIRPAKGWYHCHQSPVAHRGPGYS